ncbi:MAG: hypothetical protein HC849_17550 [Oscillatoriales cyanobacterium RU_3_3]|nr:hypothetical protein [Microcoleus sp. SU_5_6]NJM61596.1 hypothetical protein [Oscillatoriales cyanobacterium RU_3_3]NJR24734.1 hypothetical protein [Richelia sp. CSU_2_1]
MTRKLETSGHGNAVSPTNLEYTVYPKPAPAGYCDRSTSINQVRSEDFSPHYKQFDY